MKIYISESFDEAAYKRWKRANVTLRGINPDYERLDQPNDGFANFGAGLYTVPLSNKAMAKQYGDVYFVVNGRPKKPAVFRNISEAETWLYNFLIRNYYKTYGIEDTGQRKFYELTNIRDEMLRIGYDGLEIKGREMVNYDPQNVYYFKYETGLRDYFNYVIQSN